MNKQILFPIDFQTNLHLADYAQLLSHVDKKSFIGFFLRDFSRQIKSKEGDQEKNAIQLSLREEARQLNLDFDFIKTQASTNLLLNQSRFADLIIINPVKHDNILKLNQAFPDHFFDSIACPIFLSEDLLSPYQEILVLFDYDQSGLVALKSFLSFFGKVSSDKKVTLLTVSPDDSPEIHLEKYLVSYLQKYFNDVGIVPLNNEDLAQQVMTHATKLTRPVLVLGKTALDLLNNQQLATQVADHHMSIFYSNA
ncbi:MAG: hypothetical protein DYG99_07770 [Bacteroidetes bacterium CHB5]|nr:hypothetical protein [Bacteroidetes bacterium CHB5]